MLTVWSEVPEPNATGYKDCLYCTYLMGLVYGGFDEFPLGINTVAEREAFERAQHSHTLETGAFMTTGDEAASNRYGTRLRKVQDIKSAFLSIGSYIACTGWNGYGTRTAHAMGVIPTSATACLIFNPLAANDSVPVVGKIADIKAWMQRGIQAGVANDYRIVDEDELSMTPIVAKLALVKADGTAATTVAEIDPRTALITPDGKHVKPTKVIYTSFALSNSRPDGVSEPAFACIDGGTIVYVIARNAIATD